MRKIIFILILSLSIFVVSRGFAGQEEDDLKLLEELGIEPEQQEAYKFPVIKPKIELMLGYRFTDVDGSKRSFEYEYLKSSPLLGFDIELYKHPYRLHFDLNFTDEKDYQADLAFADGELILMRWFNSTLFHNTDNIELIDLSPSSPNYSIDRRDGGEDYGVRTGINGLMLRAKMPNFPAHAFFNLFHVMKDGSAQQRSLLGQGYFFDVERATMEREIDWQTGTYEIGANSHLGHAEVEYSHIEKRFEAKKDETMYDAYTANPFRPAGTYPHNQIPELKGSSNVLKVHSNYNESLVASATFSAKERDNQTSGASADIFQGAGALQWTPLTRLSFFMKYSHIDVDADNPSTASITDINGSKITYPGSVKSPISKRNDLISLTGRYNLRPGVILKAKYLNENIERDNASDWGLQDSTRKNTYSLSADLRVIKRVDIKTEYIHQTVDQPSYNTEPDNSDQGIASVSWIPAPGINLLVNYSISKDTRDHLHFTGADNARDRDSTLENVMGSGTFQLLNNLSMTASYAFIRSKIRQDIVYGTVVAVDNDVPYESKAQIYSASLNYIPINKLAINALIAHSKSDSEFSPSRNNLLQPVSVASFSREELAETTYRLTSDYKCMDSYLCGIDFQYNDIDDLIDNIHDYSQDGHAYIILLTLKKTWE
jgi:predicted porin